mmetsp:Transcript_19381/g.33475  ORF Transcript_19381/g.33475 Transcript_19381/m.33475 type:complete len:265 (-) Transcript_19381:1174-1968(-)
MLTCTLTGRQGVVHMIRYCRNKALHRGICAIDQRSQFVVIDVNCHCRVALTVDFPWVWDALALAATAVEAAHSSNVSCCPVPSPPVSSSGAFESVSCDFRDSTGSCDLRLYAVSLPARDGGTRATTCTPSSVYSGFPATIPQLWISSTSWPASYGSKTSISTMFLAIFVAISSSSSCTPSPVCPLTHTVSLRCAATRRTSSWSGHASILFHAVTIGMSPTPRSPSTCNTASHCAAAFAWLMSTRCSSTDASWASSSVALKAAIS